MLLIDGYNVIHAVPWLRDLLEGRGQQAATRALVDVCARWSGQQRKQVVLVLDGVRPRGAPLRPGGRLSVRYMDDADADLKELLSRRGHHCLVSADGELVRAARNLANDVEAPGEFMGRVLQELKITGELDEKQRLPSDAEVAEWLEVFGGGEKTPPIAQDDGLSAEEVKEWKEFFDS